MNSVYLSYKKYLSYFLVILICRTALADAHSGLLTHAFVQNKGQILNQDYLPNNEVLYLYTGKSLKVQLRKSGYSYELFKIDNAPTRKPGKDNVADLNAFKNVYLTNYRVDIDFEGMNENCSVIAEQGSPDYLNYYVCGQEATNIRAYTKVTYQNVYKNTDIEFIIQENEASTLKYNIILHPGAEIEKIKFLIRGASEIKIENNILSLHTPFGKINEKIPASYYLESPQTKEKVVFKLDKNTVSFSANYDKSKTLIIDPSSNLIWSTYYSGPLIDYCSSTGVDPDDNVYIAGYTFSTSNIATNNSFQSIQNGVLDAFLVKFNPNGVRQWATYFGGSSVEQIYAMHIGSDGFIYITGDTFSTSNIATPGAHQTTYGGGQDDVLLVKFDNSGQRLWATYLGGTEHEFAQAATTDTDGNVIIAGHTRSLNNMATPNAYSTTYNFGEEGFIAKFTGAGVLLWCTYYGDSGEDIVYSVATDETKNVYVTGITSSIAGIATNGSHQPAIGGALETDAFLTKFNPQGTGLEWATYYGGTAHDEGTAVRVGPDGKVYLTGNTSSNNNIATPTAYQPLPASAEDGFLAAFNGNGVRQWGTYFGGDGTDYINDMVLDANSNLVFGGQTLSTNSISTTGAYQSTICTPGNYDAYFEKFSKTGARKLGTYFGSVNNENARGICVDKTGKVYLAGETTSTIGIATAGAHQTAALGSSEGFLAKFCMDIEPIITPANTTICIGPATISAVSGYSTYLWSNGSTINPIIVNTTTVAGTYQFTVYVTDGFGCSGSSNTITLTTKPCGVFVHEYELNQLLALYPVPSSDYLTLKTNNENSGPLNIEIYSVSGQLILTTQLMEKSRVIDIKNLQPGIYFLHTSVDGTDYYAKFIKE